MAQTDSLMPESSSRRTERSPALTIMALLLFLQAGLLYVLALYHLGILGFTLPSLANRKVWENGVGAVLQQFGLAFEFTINHAIENQELTVLVESLALLLLTVLAIMAGIGFLRLWRTAWFQAMFLQGGSLGLALTLYFLSKPTHIYILMAYSIFMVLYLKYSDVERYFVRKPETQGGVTFVRKH